ncbi:MAG: hypothetical protein M1484_02185 [Patescibacteria group bacterium]|nr:hypothetical protein [Patescibacteria group bacterium]
MKPQIDFSDFSKLDLRVGEIIEAREVEGSERLVELKVNFGEFQRVIYAGIKQWYTPESLKGKKLIFVVNLVPKRFKIGDRELVSEGMLVAAGTDEAILYNFDKDVSPNTIIR